MRSRRATSTQGFEEAEVVIEREYTTASSTRATSSRRTAPPSGTGTASSPSGPPRRARSPCAPVADVLGRSAGLAHDGRADGDRRRLRRQDHRLPGAVAALLSKKTGRPVKMWMPRAGRLPRHRPHLRHLQPRALGAKRDGTITGRRGLPRLRGRRLPRLRPSAPARLRPRAVRHPEPGHRRLRRVVNTPKVAGLPRPGRARVRVRGGVHHRRARGDAGDGPDGAALKNAAHEGTRTPRAQPWPRIGARGDAGDQEPPALHAPRSRARTSAAAWRSASGSTAAWSPPPAPP
jgi:hypothetical protein